MLDDGKELWCNWKATWRKPVRNLESTGKESYRRNRAKLGLKNHKRNWKMSQLVTLKIPYPVPCRFLQIHSHGSFQCFQDPSYQFPPKFQFLARSFHFFNFIQISSQFVPSSFRVPFLFEPNFGNTGEKNLLETRKAWEPKNTSVKTGNTLRKGKQQDILAPRFRICRFAT